MTSRKQTSYWYPWQFVQISITSSTHQPEGKETRHCHLLKRNSLLLKTEKPLALTNKSTQMLDCWTLYIHFFSPTLRWKILFESYLIFFSKLFIFISTHKKCLHIFIFLFNIIKLRNGALRHMTQLGLKNMR